jgi:hypothetical protein
MPGFALSAPWSRVGKRVLRCDSLLADQVAWIRDHAHPRRITEENGRASLALAIEAARMANAGASP